jgi:MacB-like periplasmic core domain
VLHDLRYSVRTLRRSPGFALSAILALALGIGANTAVFSVVDAVLLKPLPYAEPDRLVRLYERNAAEGIERGPVSPGTFIDWRSRSHSLERVAVFSVGKALWAFGDQYDIVRFSAVSPALFDVFRVHPMLGRTFRPESQQSRPDGDVGEVVISFNLWQRRFAGDPSVLGRTVSVESHFSLSIIGVMPKGFAFPAGVDAWGNRALLGPIGPEQRQQRYNDVVARLAPGVTVTAARGELAGLSSQIALEQPRSNADWTAEVEPLADSMRASVGPALLALLGAVGVFC